MALKDQIMGCVITVILLMVFYKALHRCRPWITRQALTLERLRYGHEHVQVNEFDVRVFQIALACVLATPALFIVSLVVSLL